MNPVSRAQIADGGFHPRIVTGEVLRSMRHDVDLGDDNAMHAAAPCQNIDGYLPRMRSPSTCSKHDPGGKGQGFVGLQQPHLVIAA